MKYAAAFVLGVLVCIFAVGTIGKAEDAAIAEKCDYAGKVKLDGRVYTCAAALTQGA